MSAPETGRAQNLISPLIRRISGSSDGGPSSLSDLRDSETAKAVGLAAAMIANNIIALGSSIVFARLIGDYGSLAALVSYLLILTVFGQAMQVATAREGVLGHLGEGQQLLATLRRWMVTLSWVTAVVTVISILARQPIADLVGVKSDGWAAAAGLPAGCLYLALSILRGGLQGIGDYKSVGLSLIGEQGSRLVLGAALAIIGLGVAGAYLGSLLSYVVMSLYCWGRLYGQLGGTALVPGSAASPAPVSLRRHVWGAWVAIAGLAVIQLLQNIDLITAKHQFDKNTASAYAVTAVAAKVLIWVAMGAGFYLVPEASRRRAAGEDTRPVLFGALADRRRLCDPVPADLRVRGPPAAVDRVRAQARDRLGRATPARSSVRGAGGHVSRGPVHAGAETQGLSDRDRRGRRDRADLAAARGQAAGAVRRRRAAGPGDRRRARVRARAAPPQGAAPAALGSAGGGGARAGPVGSIES